MRRWIQLLLLLVAIALVGEAAEVTIDEKVGNSQKCSGMYGRKSWGGDVDPFILVKFVDTKDMDKENGVVSLIIFEWKDKNVIGKTRDPQDPEDKEYICSGDAVAQGFCKEEQLGEWILADNAEKDGKSKIITQAVHLNDDSAGIRYPVEKTGYYCVATDATGTPYKAVIEFRNAYGELPAAQIAKLPFYGGMTIVYALIGFFWAFLYVQNRHDILPVQNYITAIIVFLVIEMLMTWGFYNYQNSHGLNLGTRAFMIIVAILNAGRNSFSFFLLLIVCMGYGVVKPSLGKTMITVRWLAAAHFLFGVVYAVASLTIHPDEAGPFVLLVILPLSGTLTAFYIWTLNSLNATMKDLVTRKQTVKANMYKKLGWAILASILVIFAFFFFNSFTFVGVGNEDFAPSHWQTRWFVLDGWLNLVYLADVSFVAYVWRPTANNRRFAMSDEIAQDDEGFEIASVRDSFDEEDNPSSASLHGSHRDQINAAGLRPDGGGGPPPAYEPINRNQGPSPLPAPKPQRPASLPRESLEGETIFAVGEEDRWSDDEADDDERKRLTAKDD